MDQLLNPASLGRMKRILTLLLVCSAALGVSGDLSAQIRPSERACLVSWNARSNLQGRERVAAGAPWRAAVLVAAKTGWVTINPVGSSFETPACVLLLVKSRRMREVVGPWRSGRVTRWRFSPLFSADEIRLPSNVKVLTDGRVRKIYRD